MGRLQVLSSQLANMIAAGEVVGRPASVVKELMENSLDAGASSVDVIITDAGRTSIQVVDNGCGMSPEDALLCFERHATSKISSPEDLESISTFGFRGEALPSIAAVAEVVLKTRRSGDETAVKVETGSFSQMTRSFCQAPVGTSISVRNLFYNTPARRKFLKSDNIEFRHIINEFTHIALTRPDVSFSLTHNGSTVLSVRKAKSVKFRILDLLGESVVGDIVDLSGDSSLVRISGFTGRPESSRKSQPNQFFFVNGRYFRSPYLHKAVMNAYADFIPDGVSPAYIIFLEVDPGSVDVNISPTKSEVKFEEDAAVFQAIYACVRSSLGRNGFSDSLDFDAEGAAKLPELGRSFDEYRPVAIEPSASFDPLYNPFDVTPGGWSSGKEDASALFEGVLPAAPKESAPADPLVVKGRFIVVESNSGMMVVDARKAGQRILYEQALRSLRSGEEHITQKVMFPVQVQVGPAPRLLFDENSEILRSLGFDISPIGNDTIAVGGVPEGFEGSEQAIHDMVGDLLGVLAVDPHGLPEIMHSNMASKFSAMAARHFAPIANKSQAQSLLEDLFGCENSETTPSGSRITWIIDIDELEKKF